MKYYLKRQEFDERDFLFSTLIGTMTVWMYMKVLKELK